MTTPNKPRPSKARLPKVILWVMVGILALQLAWTIFLAAAGADPILGIQGMILPIVIAVACAIWLKKVRDRESREMAAENSVEFGPSGE